jgi:hypothetical protein
LNLPPRHQSGQSTLQGAPIQAIAQQLGNGVYTQPIGLRSNQREQLVKLRLGRLSWHGFWLWVE